MKLKSIRDNIPHRKNQRSGLTMGLFGLVFIVGCSTPAERLSKAASTGNTQSAARILSAGFNPKDATPQLVTAAARGYVDIIKLLLDAGTGIDQGNRTPLMSASANGKLEAVKILVERGANVNKQEDAFEIRDLQYLSDNGRESAQFREALIKQGGNSALSLAILNKRTAVVQHLLQHSADANRHLIYKDPVVHSPINIAGFGNVTVRMSVLDDAGRPVDLITSIETQSNGDRNVTTTSRFEREQKATPNELAQLSGDKEIAALFSVTPKQNTDARKSED